MNTKKNIAVVAGGFSSEYEVSLKSAKNIFDAIDDNRYNKYLLIIKKDGWNIHTDNGQLPLDKNDFSFCINNEKVKIDFAYITIHGNPGENGRLQGYLEMMDIPHSTCDTLCSALTFDKYKCNQYLKQFDIKIANSVLLKDSNYDTDEVIAKIGIPCFVKPNSDGSSFGISKVKTTEQLRPAIDNAFKFGKQVLAETFINGKEFTCGLVKTDDRAIVLPVTEVIPKNEFFDFEAKYDPKMADEITPARISEELTLRIQNMSSRIYDLLNCKGLVRVDYIIKDDIIYLLEVNTTPGMTATSFIPQQVRAAGLELRDVLTLIIEQELQ